MPIHETVENCQENDFEIQRQTPVPHVIQVVLDSLRDRTVAPAQSVDLRPPSYPTLNIMSCHISWNFLPELLHEECQLWAGTNYTHVAFHDVDELRKLVEACPPEDPADRCNPTVAPLGVPSIRFSRIVYVHCSKLEHREASAVQTYSFLGKKCRSTRRKLDHQNDQ